MKEILSVWTTNVIDPSKIRETRRLDDHHKPADDLQTDKYFFELYKKRLIVEVYESEQK